jgi:hypothetical protein
MIATSSTPSSMTAARAIVLVLASLILAGTGGYVLRSIEVQPIQNHAAVAPAVIERSALVQSSQPGTGLTARQLRDFQ